jgi:hypothetical protein
MASAVRVLRRFFTRLALFASVSVPMSDCFSLEYAGEVLGDVVERNDEVMRHHHESREKCWHCEDAVSYCNKVFAELVRQDEEYRIRVYEQCATPDAKFERSQVTYFLALQVVSREVDRMVREASESGYDIDGAAEFQENLRQVNAIADNFKSSNHTMPPAIASLRDEAVREYQHGKTAEFLSDPE